MEKIQFFLLLTCSDVKFVFYIKANRVLRVMIRPTKRTFFFVTCYNNNPKQKSKSSCNAKNHSTSNEFISQQNQNKWAWERDPTLAHVYSMLSSAPRCPRTSPACTRVCSDTPVAHKPTFCTDLRPPGCLCKLHGHMLDQPLLFRFV